MTKVQLCGFNTFLGICQNWLIIETDKPFYLGKVIVCEYSKKRGYIYFSETKKIVFPDWDEFKLHYGFENIELEKGFYKKPKCEDCGSTNLKPQPTKLLKTLCVNCFNEF